MPRCLADLTRYARLAAGVFVLAWLGGCATPQTTALLKAPPAALPARTELTGVPYYAQEIHQCGPATLAMAFGAAGVERTPEALVPEVYLPGRAGSLQVEMLAATRRNGLVAYPLAPQLRDLLEEVAAGTPAIVLQNLAFSWYPIWHYSVVIGYDLQSGDIILRSGPERRQVLPLTTFEHIWARSGRWAMLALPPTRLPRTAQEDRYVAAAVALEQTGPPAAARGAYATAATRWPADFTARMGLGNTAYAQGDFAAAAQAFSAATAAHPEAGAAYNNLADTLAHLRRYPEALAAAQRAVQLGGPEQAVFAQTLAQIKQAMRNRLSTPPPADTAAPVVQ